MKQTILALSFLIYSLLSQAQVSYSIWGGINIDYWSELGSCDGFSYNGEAYIYFYDFEGNELYEVYSCLFSDGYCNGTVDLDPADVDLEATIAIVYKCNGSEAISPDVVTASGVVFQEYFCTFGCDDPIAANYNLDVDILCNDLCYYDPSTFCNANETLYTITGSGGCALWGMEFEVFDQNNNLVYPNNLPYNETFGNPCAYSISTYFCVENNECYTLSAFLPDTINGWDGTYYVTGLGAIDLYPGAYYEPLLTPYPASCINVCNDPDACNYDIFLQNSGSTCCYDECGCLDPNASNYDSSASCESECEYQLLGTVFFDNDGNGIMDGEDYGLAFQEVTSDNGETYITNDDGQFYGFYTLFNTSSYSLTFDENFGNITTSLTQTITLGTYQDSEFTDLQFGVNSDTPSYEICVDFYPNVSGYPCNDWVNHNICYRNNGNLPIDGIIEIEYDVLFQNYYEVSEIDSVVDNKIYMSFEDLIPGQMYFYDVSLLTPTVDFIGEYIQSTARIYGFHEGIEVAYGDEELEMEMTCAYDPNDKQVFPNGYEEPHYVLPQTELEYVVRFQNTGNAPATNVIIRDTIEENLDFSTFELMANSHSVITTINAEDRTLEFFFENIMLPDSIANEPESHGLVSFKIRPYSDLPFETEINNTAFIYFDNNPAIVTNTTWNTIYNCTNGLANFDLLDNYICIGGELSFSSDQEYVESYDWIIADSSVGNEYSGYAEVFENGTITLVAQNPLCEATQSEIFELYPTEGDLDQNGKIDVLDFLLVSNFFGTEFEEPLLSNGDANLDGVCNINDLLIVLLHFGTECE